MMEETLFRLRVRYVKQGRLRYLGHLEVARTIERSVRRAGLPFAITQGFSPHMRIAYTAALPVGTSSVAEWYDLILTSYVPAADALARLGAATPADLRPVHAGYRALHDETLGALITHQDYRATLTLADSTADAVLPAARAALAGIVAQGTLTYLRGRKEKVLDVAALLDHAELSRGAAASDLVLDLRTRSSNAGSLRPEILISALDGGFGRGDAQAPLVSGGALACVNFSRIEIERVDQYGEDDEHRRIDPL